MLNLDWKQNLNSLFGFGFAVLIVWWVIVYGIGEPFDSRKLIGLTEEQVRMQFGAPSLTWKSPEGTNWHYKNGVLPWCASSDVIINSGLVVDVRGHTPNK